MTGSAAGRGPLSGGPLSGGWERRPAAVPAPPGRAAPALLRRPWPRATGEGREGEGRGGGRAPPRWGRGRLSLRGAGADGALRGGAGFGAPRPCRPSRRCGGPEGLASRCPRPALAAPGGPRRPPRRGLVLFLFRILIAPEGAGASECRCPVRLIAGCLAAPRFGRQRGLWPLSRCVLNSVCC